MFGCLVHLHCLVLNDLALTYYEWGKMSAAIENYEKSLTLDRYESDVSNLEKCTSTYSYMRLSVSCCHSRSI